MHNVIVVGGGPVGSYLAYRLADMGYEVVVLERKEKIGDRVCCTGIIGRECARDFPLADNVVLRQANSARLFSPCGRAQRVWRQEPQAFIIDRPAFDQDMADRAKGKGVSYVLGSLVSQVRVDNKRIVVEATHQGEAFRFEAKVAIIASGFGLRLTERLGLGQVSDFVAGARAEVVTNVDEVEVYFGQSVAPGFFAWLVPTSSHRALAGLLSRRSPGAYLKNLLSSLKAQGKIDSTEVKLSYGGIPLKPLSRTYADRMLVVGDAAGQVKPTTGGGIYYGLLCADIAANVLHQGLKSDNLSARYLAKYEREWKRRLGRELAIGYWARKFYERLSDSQIEKMFDIITATGMDKALSEAEDLSFDWHGEVVLRLLRQRAVAKAIDATKMPISLRRKFFWFLRRADDE